MPAKKRKDSQNKLVAMMVVRNEANRYLKIVLDQVSTFVDCIVILDDASTDATPEVCASYRKVILHRNKEPLFFHHEALLRTKLWEHVIQTEPDWILALDADELFEERIYGEIQGLLNQVEFDGVEFRLFDFWKGFTHYRIDGSWNPWKRFNLFLVRYFPEVENIWPDRPFHCGRWPLFYNKGNLISFQSDIRLKHFGWAREEEHKKKYLAYKAMDPEGKFLSKEHLESVLASADTVALEKWKVAKTLPF